MRAAINQDMLQSTKPSPPPVSNGASLDAERIPPTKEVRERLRALSADMVASWSCEGLPAEVKLQNGLRKKAEGLVLRAHADLSFVGWRK